MNFITKNDNSVLRNDVQNNLTCVFRRIEATFRKFLHNRHLVGMTMKIIMKSSPHRTIGESKGRRMFACRTPQWSSYCLNVLRWSNGPRDSSSSSCLTCSLPESSDPRNNWFPVRDRGQRSYIKSIPKKGAIICLKSGPQQQTRPIALRYDINWPNGAHFKKEVMLPRPV